MYDCALLKKQGGYHHLAHTIKLCPINAEGRKFNSVHCLCAL
jgi:hypothetical protein